VSEVADKLILVACIGNIFLGDDGFGCEVARALAAVNIPPEVRIVDYGIRSIDLAYALLEPYSSVILVDAVRRGARPGTVFLLQPLGEDIVEENAAIDPHSINPARLLAAARSLGRITAEIYIVGCEPSDFGDELEGRFGLSEAVLYAVPEAVRTVLELIARISGREAQEIIHTCSGP
jgi:hydrogenase maturation protease